MKNLLSLIGILCILASCKKNNVEPIPASNTKGSANLLPSFVYKTKSADQNQTVYRFAYYSNGLLKKITQYDSVYNSNQKDSTLYTYNSSNKVVEISEYSGGNFKSKTEISYNTSGNIETIWEHNDATQFSITYKYIYASSNDVAYVLKYDATNTVTDSIVIDDNVILQYYKSLPGDPQFNTAVDGYAAYNPLHCFPTQSGVFIDPGIRSPDDPRADKWGYVYNDHSLSPAFLNKNINFQYEVADKFISVGLTGFPDKNFYIIPGPRQYYIGIATVNTSGYGTTYKFDQDDRLIQSIRHFDYYTRSGSPIPGYETIEVRY